MTAAFPIPSKLAQLSGLTDQRKSAKIRSSVDVGPALVRRRFTAAVRNINVPGVYTQTERNAFDTWYINDLVEGSLQFTWLDPSTGSTVNMRFATEDGPLWTAISGGVDAGKWSTTLALEILP